MGGTLQRSSRIRAVEITKIRVEISRIPIIPSFPAGANQSNLDTFRSNGYFGLKPKADGLND